MQTYQNYIEANPNVMFGKPCVKGTRIPVDLILEKLGNGETFDDLLDAYPRISNQAILACLTFASLSIRNEEVIRFAA